MAALAPFSTDLDLGGEEVWFPLDDNILLDAQAQELIQGLVSDLQQSQAAPEASVGLQGPGNQVLKQWAEPGSGVQKKRAKRDEAARSRRKAEKKRAEMKAAEEAVAAKLAEYQALAQANAALKHRHLILERLVNLRTGQLGVIKQYSSLLSPGTSAAESPLPMLHVQTPESSSGATSHATSLTSDGSSGTIKLPSPRDSSHMGSDFEIQVAGSSGGAEGPHSAAASAITGVGVGHQDAVGHVNLQRDSETSQKIAEFSEIAGCSGNWDAVLDAQGNVDLTQLARHTHGFRSLTQSEVAAFTGINPQTFVSAYKTVLGEVSQALLTLETQPQNSAAKLSLARHVGETMHLFKHTSLLAPDIVLKVQTLHLETMNEAVPSSDHWRSLIAVLGLSAEQQRDLCELWLAYQRLMGRVVSERARIQQLIAERGESHEAAYKAAITNVSVECEVLSALMRNLRQEKSLALMMRGFFFGQELNILQAAKTLVYSYPFFPDAVAIIAALQSDLQVQQLHQGGALGALALTGL